MNKKITVQDRPSFYEVTIKGGKVISIYEIKKYPTMKLKDKRAS